MTRPILFALCFLLACGELGSAAARAAALDAGAAATSAAGGAHAFAGALAGDGGSGVPAPSLAAALRAAGVAESALTGSIHRRVLTGDVAEYSFQLRVGSGAHDVIGLHRVVRELAPFLPVPTARAIMMVHGDIWNFDQAFVASAAAPPGVVAPNHALPIYLARHGIDVWGIDLRWSLVPADTTDLSFMQTWGASTDAGDVSTALVVARVTRLASGDGAARIHLLGWSRGGILAYLVANNETQLPAALRQVAGLVPVDIFLHTDDEGVRLASCARAAAEQAQIDAGVYAATSGELFATLGSLAVTAPGDPSPIVPGVTNLQAALLAGSATYQFLPPDQVFVPLYHFTGGTFDGSGLPTGLTYTPEAAWFSFMGDTSPFESEKVLADTDAVLCGGAPPGGDHLAAITVPVLFVGAGGGIGSYGVYTTTLLGSHDVTTHVVQLQPAADRALDIGHVDIFNATDAPTLFWQPILTWLQSH